MQFSQKKIISTFLCLWFFAACSTNQKQSSEEPLARVYDKYLYPSDIRGLITENTSAEDSTKIAEEYIDSWIRHNLILKVSEDNLQSRLPEIDKQAKEYRESLVIYAYEKQWLAENLDTLVTADTLQKYFEEHPQEFILKQDIYKISYAIVDAEIKSFDSLRTWLSKDISIVRNELESYCMNNCKSYIFDSQNWLSEDALFKLLPLQMFENNRLQTSGIVEYSDGTDNYIIKVHDRRNAGILSPFEYAKNDVLQIILSKRKMEILKKNYQNMYSEGFRQNDAEIYKQENP